MCMLHSLSALASAAGDPAPTVAAAAGGVAGAVAAHPHPPTSTAYTYQGKTLWHSLQCSSGCWRCWIYSCHCCICHVCISQELCPLQPRHCAELQTELCSTADQTTCPKSSLGSELQGASATAAAAAAEAVPQWITKTHQACWKAMDAS